MVADLCAKLKTVLAKGGNELETGPLGAKRSFLDVRDLVPLLPRLLELTGKFEIVNLASPSTHQIREIVEKLVLLSGKKVTIREKAQTAVNSFAGLEVNTGKMQRLLHPSFRPLEETLKDTLEGN